MHVKLEGLLSKSLTTLEVMAYYLVVHTGPGRLLNVDGVTTTKWVVMCQMAIFMFLYFLKVNSMLFTMVKPISNHRSSGRATCFEYGGTTFGTFGKTCFKCWRLLYGNNGAGFKYHVFDHETRKSGLLLCYRRKINDFLSSYNQNLKKWHFHTPTANSLLLQK